MQPILCSPHCTFNYKPSHQVFSFYCGLFYLHRLKSEFTIASGNLGCLDLSSQMGTTGSSVSGTVNTALPDIIAGVREYATVPLAVGFGVATREHFNLVADAGADGVVIGSRLVAIIKASPPDQLYKNVEAYCLEISHKGRTPSIRPSPTPRSSSRAKSNVDAKHTEASASDGPLLPHRFGQFGGQYVPESLFDCLVELEEAHNSAINDPEFWKEFRGLYGYMNRPSNLYKAEKLTEHGGGATIWLKREDLYVLLASSFVIV